VLQAMSRRAPFIGEVKADRERSDKHTQRRRPTVPSTRVPRSSGEMMRWLVRRKKNNVVATASQNPSSQELKYSGHCSNHCVHCSMSLFTTVQHTAVAVHYMVQYSVHFSAMLQCLHVLFIDAFVSSESVDSNTSVTKLGMQWWTVAE
jgi:hypothetical protein